MGSAGQRVDEEKRGGGTLTASGQRRSQGELNQRTLAANGQRQSHWGLEGKRRGPSKLDPTRSGYLLEPMRVCGLEATSGGTFH